MKKEDDCCPKAINPKTATLPDEPKKVLNSPVIFIKTQKKDSKMGESPCFFVENCGVEAIILRPLLGSDAWAVFNFGEVSIFESGE